MNAQTQNIECWVVVSCMGCAVSNPEACLLEDWPTAKGELESQGWSFPYPQPPIVESPRSAYKAGFCPNCPTEVQI